MSWDDFWHGDCMKVKYYREADRIRQQRINYEAWLNGRYVYEAVADLSPILRFTMSKTPVKPLEYPAEPYPMSKEEHEERKAREEKAKMEAAKQRLKSWATRVNSSKKQKEVKQDG